MKNINQIKDAATPSDTTFGGVSRRDLLKVGSLSVLGLSLPELFRMPQAAAATKNTPPAKSCILLFLNGGPSHLDTWDPKPNASSEYRGEFSAISTNVAGIQVSEHLPRMAHVADKLAILRSLTSPEGGHARACHYMLTGQRMEVGVEHAAYGSVMLRAQRTRNAEAGYVAIPQMLRGGSAGHLGASFEPSAAGDLSREPDAVQERYGKNEFGRGCLRARQLVEAGTRFVTVSHTGWDTHGNNFRHLRDHQLPPLDLGFSALVADLEARGLLDDTLVVCMGDFGRTPKINAYAGRDHWPACQSVVFAGGGVRGGQVIGRSDETGSYPAERPATPADLAATIYAALGVDPRHAQPHSAQVTETGRAVKELLA